MNTGSSHSESFPAASRSPEIDSNQLTIATVIALSYEHSLRLLCDSDATEMEHAVTPDRKVTVWWTQVPRAQLRRRVVRLAISATERKMISSDRRITSVAEVKVADDLDYLFLFSPAFADWNLRSNEQTESQFLYFFEHFVQRPDYKTAIPQLIQQYNPQSSYYSAPKVNLNKRVDRIVERTRDHSCEFAQCVLAVIGSLTVENSRVEMPKCTSELLSRIDAQFMSQLNESRDSRFVTAVVRGVEQCLASGKAVSLSTKKAVVGHLLAFERLPESSLTKALDTIESIENAELAVWMGAIRRQRNAHFLIRRLLMKVEGYAAVFIVFQSFEDFFTEKSNDQGLMKEAQARVKGESRITRDYQPAVEEIEEILDIVSSGSSRLKTLFEQSKLPNVIKSYLDYPSRAKFSLYKRLFVTHSQFPGRESKEKFLVKLCKAENVAFADVANELKPEQRYVEAIFQEWMQAHCPKQSYWSYFNNSGVIASTISMIDGELQRLLGDAGLVKLLSEKAVEFINSQFPLSSQSLPSIAKSIDAVQTKQLKLSYAAHPSVLSCLFGNDELLRGLLREKSAGKESWLIDNLLERTFGASKVLTYEEVEDLLVRQKQIEPMWLMLMKDFRYYKSFKLASKLQESLQKFTRNVQTRALSISKFLQLSAKTPEQLQAIYELMLYAVDTDQVRETLQSAFSEAIAIAVRISLLQQFSANIISDPTERAAALEEIKNAQTTYQEALLADFRFTPKQEVLYTCAKKAEKFNDSGLFQAKIKQAQGNAPITIATAGDVCARAIADVLASVSGLLQSLASKKVREVLEFLAAVEDWKREVDLLERAQPEWSAGLRELSKGLEHYTSHKRLIRNFNSLISILKSIQREDPEITRVAGPFLSETVEDKTFQELVAGYNQTVGVLYPDGDVAKYEPAFEVLAELKTDSELLTFLQYLSDERLRHLLECVNDYDESAVTAQLISELENVWFFFNGLRDATKCKQLVMKAWEQMQLPSFYKIKQSIKLCAVHINAFMEFATNLEKKEEAKMRQMEAFYKASVVAFVKEDKGYAVSAQYSSRKQTPYNLAYLQELKDRASLSLHTANSKDTQEDSSSLSILRIFVEFVAETNTTAEALISLHSYGYPIDVAEGRQFRCEDGNFQELQKFQKQTTELLQGWKNTVEEAYVKSYPLTFLFGEQFWTVEAHLDGKVNSQAESLLSYMHRKAGSTPRETDADPKLRLTRLGEKLSALPCVSTATLQVSYEAPVEARIKCPAGCVLYISVPEERVLNALISAYLNSGRAFPQAHQVMNCTHRPQWAELQAFLYRCFTSPQGEMFALIGTERLPLELQTDLRSLFAKLVSLGIGKGQLSLVVITSEDRSLLAEYFQLLEDPKCIKARSEQIISDDAALGKFVREINTSVCGSPTVVVRSETAGQGKSTWVKSQAEALHLPVRKFPIAGDLDLEAICAQLLGTVRPDCVLLMTLSHVDASEVLNDLLTSICLLRTVRAGSLIVSFPPTCRVYIEVQKLHPPLQLPFLKHLKQETVAFDINRFKPDEECKTVIAYLQLYETNAIARGNVETVQVTPEMAVRHLNKHFLASQSKRGQPLSFLALRSFISLVSTLLTAMEQGPFNSAMIDLSSSDAEAAGVPQLKAEYENLRAHIVESFLETSKEVTTRSVASVREAQEKAVGNEVSEPALQCTLSWDQSNHFSMIFLQDGAHVAIYRKHEHVPTSLKKLIYLQSNCQRLDGPTLMQHIASNQYQINDYSNLTHVQALCYLQTYAKMGKDLVTMYSNFDYVLTQDNFLKMNLIYLRAIARLPIVIMGETGCGKTSLISFFVREVLSELLEVVNIHAGVTSEVLSQHVSRVCQLAKADINTRLWVFFDEFNTSHCVGYICEMLCERTFRGEELPPNLVLLAACNPYRLRSSKLKEENVGIKKSERYQKQTSQNLMHIVKPLPESMIEYIWDFGALTENDYRKYIESMLMQTVGQDLREVFINLVFESQKYFQTNEDVSSVSLRDVARFVILYRWFETSLKVRKTMRNGGRFRQNCENYKLRADWQTLDDRFCAGVLALCNCYYYRLAKQEHRLDFLRIMCRQSNGALSVERIEDILRCNEDDLIARMELPEATALNQAFRENVSCIIHCVLSKVALFICGKPGCSKSLAVQLVFSNLRGSKSIDPYFCTLLELVMVPFQGSESSTSTGIEKTFARARRFHENERLLPVVVFDEIGLAEISKNNPLKVLHSLLELENRSVGFVGVSNWRLDASKMNRAMYLARPDPDQYQLVFTARSILSAGKQHEPTTAQYQLVEAMAIAYFDFKQEHQGSRDEDFFGLRDFYSMIKQASSLIINSHFLDLAQTFAIIKFSVERNFGGKADASSRMLAHIFKLRPEFLPFSYLPPTSPIDLINSNLEDTNSRFLMLICKGDVAAYALDRHIKLPQAERRTLVGSHMREDEGGEEYAFRSLSDMVLYMEKGFCVILKDMDHVYTSLYDLFNQNYAVSGDRRYCRVALGAQFNPRCFVHSNFRVIVFMSDDEKVLEQTDAPFLNRFEKHIFDIDQVFDPQYHEALRQLQHWSESLTTLATGNELLISLSHVFPLYSLEYLKLLVLNLNSVVTGPIVDKCKEELLKMASQDVLLLVHAGVMGPKEKAYIQETWKSYHRESFLSYLSTFSRSRESSNKSLVFLYNADILENEQLSRLSIPTYYQHFSAFRREQEIVEDIVKFYRGPDQLYILDFNLAKDGTHLVMIKFVVEKIAEQMKNLQKKVCLLVRLMRNVPINIDLCWFDQWDVRTFTSITKQDLMYTYEIAKQSIEDIAQQPSFYNLEAGLGKLTLDAYETIAFRLAKPGERGEDINNHIFYIAEQVARSPVLAKALLGKLLSLLPKKHWLNEVLCRRECVARAPSIPAAISCAVELELASVYPRVIYEIDRFGAFRSFFEDAEDAKDAEKRRFLQQLWLEVFGTLDCSVHLQLLKQSNRLDFTLPLKFPFVLKDYDMINEVYKESQALSADKAKTYFLRKYSERSILREHFEQMNKSRSLYDLYLQDLIRIDLTEQRDEHVKQLLALLQNCWTRDQSTIGAKVWAYAHNRHFSFALCEVVTVLQDLKVEGIASIYEELGKLEWTGQDREYTAAKGRSMLHNRLTTIIAKTRTNSSWLNNAEAAALLKRLATQVNCLKSEHDFCLENADEVEILTLCFQVLRQAPGDPLRQLQQSAAGVTDGPFLYNEHFAQLLISTVQRSCSPDVAQHVLSTYLPKLVKLGAMKYLSMAVAHIDNEGSKLWKQSSALMAEVVNAVKLSPSKWTVVKKVEKSPVADLLERLLTEGNAATRFSVLMCDSVYWYLKKGLRYDSAKDAAVVVSKHYENFTHFCRVAARPPTEYSSVMKIYSSAFLRCYLEAYCKVMHDEISFSPDSAAQRVTSELDSESFPTARAYVLKYLMHSEKLSIPSRTPCLQLPFIRHFDFPEEYREAAPCVQVPFYERTSQWIQAVLCGRESEPIGDLVNAASGSGDTVAFATAVMKYAYIRLGNGQTNDALLSVFRTAAGTIKLKFGDAISRLICFFVENFPQGTCLHISAETSDEDKYRALALCFTLITLCANASVASPLTSLFLGKDGSLRPDAASATSRSYVCGVGIHPLYSLLRRSLYKDGASKCSCGHASMSDFSRPTEPRPCPFCVGSHASGWRPGQGNPTYEEAVAFMYKTLAKHLSAPEKGYWSFNGENGPSPLGGVALLAHAALHLMATLLLRFLDLCGPLPEAELKGLVRSNYPHQSPASHLEEQICNDFASIRRALNTEDCHLWWYAVLRQLPEFMGKYRQLPTDFATRTRVVADFTAFLKPYCQSPTHTVKVEKETSGANALSIVNETNLQALLPRFPLLHLFRLTQTPDSVSLSTALELQQLRGDYPLLSLFLQRREDVATLSLLSPLIEFTNYLRHCFSHRISRTEARTMRMTDIFANGTASGAKAKELFEKCEGVWAWLGRTSVFYGNKRFPPKAFSCEDELLLFLVDKQENGEGAHLAAALLTLAAIQNSLLNGYLAIMKRKQVGQLLDERKVPIQQLQPENVIFFSLDSMKDFEDSFVNNPAYGEGKEVIYNCQRIEDKLQANFAKGRFMSGDELDFVCYTFEMLSTTSQHSDLLTNIRSLVPQRAFDIVQTAMIGRFLAKPEGGSAELHRQELTSYYESLNSMCCFLRNAPGRADVTLLELARKVNKFNACEAFMKPPLSQVRTEYIVALYELLESALFPYVKPFVKPEFMQQTEDVSRFLNELNLSGTRPLSELQLVVMRLIIRLLMGDIDPTQRMGLYVTRPDLWAQDCSEEQVERFGTRLEQLPLAYAMQVYDFLEQCVQESLEVAKNLQLPKMASIHRIPRRGR